MKKLVVGILAHVDAGKTTPEFASPEFASWGEMIGAKSELSDGQIEERQKKQEKFKTFSCFFYALML